MTWGGEVTMMVLGYMVGAICIRMVGAIGILMALTALMATAVGIRGAGARRGKTRGRKVVSRRVKCIEPPTIISIKVPEPQFE